MLESGSERVNKNFFSPTIQHEHFLLDNVFPLEKLFKTVNISCNDKILHSQDGVLETERVKK